MLPHHIMNETQCRELFDLVRKSSEADETEAIVSGGRSALTRFANNTIHQNVEEDDVSLSVRTVFGGRTARATTNKLDPDSIDRKSTRLNSSHLGISYAV